MRKLILPILILSLLWGIGNSAYKLNPYTGKFDYYEPSGTVNDNSILPAKLKWSSGSPDNTYFYRWDGEWAIPAIQVSGNLMFGSDARGDLPVRGASSYARLSKGASGALLTGNGTDTLWSTYTLASPGAAGAVLFSNGTDWTRSTAPVISAANMTSFPTFNQNTTGTASNLSGTPTLPNGVTATTQSQADNSTKLSTTAYVDAGLSTKLSGTGSTSLVTVGDITTGAWSATTIPIAKGGTGATSASGARTSLELDNASNVSFASVYTGIGVDGERRIEFGANTTYSCPSSENSVLFIGSVPYACKSGSLVYFLDNSSTIGASAGIDNQIQIKSGIGFEAIPGGGFNSLDSSLSLPGGMNLNGYLGDSQLVSGWGVFNILNTNTPTLADGVTQDNTWIQGDTLFDNTSLHYRWFQASDNSWINLMNAGDNTAWDNITSRPTINSVTVTGTVLDNVSNYPATLQRTTQTNTFSFGIDNVITSDDILLWRLVRAITITRVDCYASTDNVVGVLSECLTDNVTSCTAVDSTDWTVTNAVTGFTATSGFENPGIAAGAWLKWVTTSVGTTNSNKLSCTIQYNE